MEFINEFILRISPLIIAYGAFGVFIASFVEEIIVPIPLSFILLSAGFFLLPATGSFEQVVLDAFLKIGIAGGLGLTLGSGVLYAVAYIGGEPAIEKWGRWFGVSWHDIGRVQSKITNSYWDEILLLISRMIPIIPHSVVSIACGVIRYPPKAFFITTFIGFTVRAFLMGLLGWSLGEAFVAYSEGVSSLGGWVAFVFALIFAGFLAFRILRKRKVL